jgi:hypothetical protein
MMLFYVGSHLVCSKNWVLQDEAWCFMYMEKEENYEMQLLCKMAKNEIVQRIYEETYVIANGVGFMFRK